MPPESKLPDREIEICHRLRAYREAVQISRSAFAAASGIGTERLASYENARAPLRWEIFTKLQAGTPIHPRWLATGRGRAVVFGFDLENYLKIKVPPRKLFTEVYDEILAPQLNQTPKRLTEKEIADLDRWLDKEEEHLVRRWGHAGAEQFYGQLASAVGELEELAKTERRMNETLIKRGLEMDLD
jgi:transcriptional regulator with XRE-family HTH domain